jgi:tetratricopeptide (TPR) repeat protein
METLFFQEGDEMSEGASAPGPDVWDEPTLITRRKRRKGRLATWTALAAAALVACAILAFWRTRGNAEPARPVAAPEPVVTPVAAPTIPPPAAPEPETIQPPPPSAAAGVLSLPSDDGALAACKKAFDRHRAKDVLAACGRAFANDPTSAEIAVMLAKTEFDRGRSRQALDWAKKAIALDENQADAYVFLGGAEQAFGRAAEAKAAYLRYLQLAPKGRFAAELRTVLHSL